MRSVRNILGWACLISTTFGIATSAIAENATSLDPTAAAAPPSPRIASAANVDSLAEIVVTAEKREQRLQDVGLTVTALGTDTLANLRINTQADLALAVPGLTFAQEPSGTPVYTLRGVGFADKSLSAYPDVATYLDQTPLPLPVLSTLTAFDLERVEVLKGPQGTLFGNNATGGAINFVAAKPTSEFHAGGEIGYGRFNTFETSGFISGPLNDTLTARLAFKKVTGDGWQEVYGTPPPVGQSSSTGRTDSTAARFLLDWKPNDRLSAELNLNAWRDESDPQVPQRYALQPQIPVSVTGPNFPDYNQPYAPNNSQAARWSFQRPPRADNPFYQTALRVDYQLFSDINLTSLTSYIDYSRNETVEVGGSPLDDDDFQILGSIHTFSQEIRLANGAKGNAVRWVVGANIERTEVNEFNNTYSGDQSSSFLVIGFANSQQTSFQKMNSEAGFANIEFDVLPNVTLKAGIRHTAVTERNIADSYSLDTTPQPGSPGPGWLNFFNATWPIYASIYCPGTTFVPVTYGHSISLNTNTCQAGTYYGKQVEHNTPFTLGIDYKPTTDVLLYANVSKGYKQGAYAEIAGATQNQYAPVPQESLLDYEAGFKTTLANGRVTINGAAFYYDYTNKQLRAQIVDPLFGLLDSLVSVPKSKVKGAEIEAVGQPFHGLRLSFSTTYLDTRIDEYDGIIGATPDAHGFLVPVKTSFAGAELPFAPKWQGIATAEYTFNVSDRWNAFVGADVTGQTKSLGSPEIVPSDVALYTMPGRALVGANAGLVSPDNRWRVAFWGKNIFNKFYVTNEVKPFDAVVRYTGRPVEYGITGSFNY